MIKDVVILGAGGFAREVLQIILDEGKYNPIGFIADPQYNPTGQILNTHPVLGGFDWLEGKGNIVKAIPAVGASELRYKFVQRCIKMGISFASAIHPTTVLSKWATIGEGVVLSTYCTVMPQAQLGNFFQANMYCAIAHDVVAGDYSTYAMGVKLAGYCSVGEGTYVGTNASSTGAKKIGRWCHIGAGAVIVNDVPDNSTAVGIPAKIVKTRDEGWYKL